MIGPEHERAAEASGPGFSDAVTFAWGDAQANVFGLARLGLSPGPRGSALAVLFADGAPAAVLAHGAVELSRDADWSSLSVAGLSAGIEEPLRRWRLAADLGDGSSVELAFEALGEPGAVEIGGMRGYEQLCEVSGEVTVRGSKRSIRCFGQRGHSWGDPDWGRTELARTVTAWLDDGSGVTLSAARPADARTHADEAIACALLGGSEAIAVAEPRLSTTYDGEGRQLRAGLELWVDDDVDYPHRAAGRAVCGSTLDLGQLRLDCAFFEWTIEGRRGLGRYDILRRARPGEPEPLPAA
jgi:hypothetical protein